MLLQGDTMRCTRVVLRLQIPIRSLYSASCVAATAANRLTRGPHTTGVGTTASCPRSHSLYDAADENALGRRFKSTRPAMIDPEDDNEEDPHATHHHHHHVNGSSSSSSSRMRMVPFHDWNTTSTWTRPTTADSMGVQPVWWSSSAALDSSHEEDEEEPVHKHVEIPAAAPRTQPRVLSYNG